jgi:hypothetical protein
MKQGDASRSVKEGGHVEPKSKGVNVTAVAQIGEMQGDHVMEKGDIPFKTEPLYAGSGLGPPRCSTTIHRSGSQGRR